MAVLRDCWIGRKAWLGRVLAAEVLALVLAPAVLRASEPAAQEYRLGPGD